MSLPPLALLVLPLAAPGDWLEALLPILFVLFWVVSQVINVAKALRGQARREPPRAPAAPPMPRQAPPDAAREDLVRQIEAFRRGQAEAGRPVPRAPDAAPPPLPRGSRPQGTRETPPPPVRPRAASPVPQGRPREASRESAAGARQPTRPAPKARPTGLGAEAVLGGHAGEIARHVDGAFAHDLAHTPAGVRAGTDAGGAGPAPVAGGQGGAGSTAADLVAMIRDPSTLRRVILLREILDRPVDRW